MWIKSLQFWKALRAILNRLRNYLSTGDDINRIFRKCNPLKSSWPPPPLNRVDDVLYLLFQFSRYRTYESQTLVFKDYTPHSHIDTWFWSLLLSCNFHRVKRPFNRVDDALYLLLQFPRYRTYEFQTHICRNYTPHSHIDPWLWSLLLLSCSFHRVKRFLPDIFHLAACRSGPTTKEITGRCSSQKIQLSAGFSSQLQRENFQRTTTGPWKVQRG